MSTEFNVKELIVSGDSGERAFECMASHSGVEMPLGVAAQIAHIKADEAYVELADKIKEHQLVMQALCKREVDAMERIARALEEPITIREEHLPSD